MAGAKTSTRQVRHERNRTEILAAARRLVVERGVDALSLREVARRAGYAPAAVYTYFESREALIAAVGSDATTSMAAYLEAVPRDGSARERLVALADAYVRFAAEEPERYRAAFGRLSVALPSWAEFARVAEPFTLIVEAFAEGIADGEFTSPEGADAMALGLWTLVHGAADLRSVFLSAYAAEVDRAARESVVAYLKGLS